MSTPALTSRRSLGTTLRRRPYRGVSSTLAILLATLLTSACTRIVQPNLPLGIPPGGSRVSPSGTFTILHTNDIHGTLSEFVVDTGDATAQTGDPGRPYQEYPRRGVIGGFARLAKAVARARDAQPAGSVLLVDAGDTFGDGLLANLTRGAATIRLMDALGYTFMALGNHDYEYGIDRTRELQAGARFPMRAANALVSATGAPFLGDPTLVVNAGGVRVGILALTYHNTDQTGNKENTRGLTFTSGIEAARNWVPALRKRADVVIVVSHQGTVVDSALGVQVPGIDIIVGGHSHDRVAPPRRVGGAWMVQALSDGSALGELTVWVVNGRVTAVNGVVHELYADRYEAEPRFARMLDSIRAPYRDTLQAVVATAADRIGRQYKSESPVDVLAGDILRRDTGADVAFLPGLGFGITLQPGPVTREMVATFFPHPTSIVHERLTGRQIMAILEQSAVNLRPASDIDRVGGLIQTSGMRWTVNLTKPTGARVSDVRIGDRPLDEGASYTVVTNAGFLQGTHRQATFALGSDIRRDARSFAAVIEDGLRHMGTLHAPVLGTITMVK